MGTSDLIPGVSGGTIALLLGIYDDFINAVSRLFSKDFLKSILFLIPIGIGMLLAIGSLSKLINYLLSEHHVPTNFFFLGLIIGIIPFLLTLANYKKNFKGKHYVLIFLGIALLVGLTLMNGGSKHEPAHLDINLGFLIKCFIGGILASSAMLLPGISGSFILLLIGIYGSVTFAISELTSFNFSVLPVIIAVGLGILVGFATTSKLINYCLTHHPYLTYAVILGLVIGSIAAIFPGLPTTPLTWIVSIITLIVGFCISYFLGKETAKTETID